jgi:hypothetical protein
MLCTFDGFEALLMFKSKHSLFLCLEQWWRHHRHPTLHLLSRVMLCHAVLCPVQAGVTDSPTDSSSSSSKASVAAVLAEPVAANQGLITGQLDNGLRYVLLGNPSPPQRFEAHLEVHAGSVDEREHEQVCRKGEGGIVRACIGMVGGQQVGEWAVFRTGGPARGNSEM